MGIAEGVKWYYELCGIRGVFAVASFRGFGKPVELSLIPPGTGQPVHLRIDTSDFCAYRDVLIFKTKSYEPAMPGFAPKTIVDVGAHIGMASILFALKYPSARIIALEPERDNFSALVRNTAGYKTITPVRAALWREDGEVTLGPSAAHVKGAFEISPNGSQRVRSVTVDTLMREAGIDSIDLLKVDIEGAEKDVFAFCPWIKNVRLLAIELHDRLHPECSQIVRTATREFCVDQRGEVTFFSARELTDDAGFGRSVLEPGSVPSGA